MAAPRCDLERSPNSPQHFQTVAEVFVRPPFGSSPKSVTGRKPLRTKEFPAGPCQSRLLGSVFQEGKAAVAGRRASSRTAGRVINLPSVRRAFPIRLTDQELTGTFKLLGDEPILPCEPQPRPTRLKCIQPLDPRNVGRRSSLGGRFPSPISRLYRVVGGAGESRPNPAAPERPNSGELGLSGKVTECTKPSHTNSQSSK